MSVSQQKTTKLNLTPETETLVSDLKTLTATKNGKIASKPKSKNNNLTRNIEKIFGPDFPLGTFSGLVTTVSAYFFAKNVIYPFVPFMIAGFFPHASKKKLGYYVGYVDGAFFCGSIIASILWARLSDKYGRKTILLSGLFGSMICTIIFGLSVNYPMALLSRFLWGALDGNIGVCKTMIGEISTASNQSKLYSTTGVLSGVGRLLGNIVGGFLSKVHLTKQFKYFLPCLISAIVTLLAFILVWKFSKETIKTKKNSKNTQNKQIEITKKVPILDVLKTRNILVSVLSRFMLSYLSGSINSLVPLWLLLNKSDNGFNWKEKDIGIIYGICGPIYTTAQLFIFPIYMSKIGYVKSTKINVIIYGILVLLLPHIAYFNYINKVYLIAILTFFISFLFILRVMALTAITVMINSAGDNNTRATANGLGQSFGSVSKFIAPIIMCNIFSYCIENNFKWPFNYCFVFYLQTIISILSVLFIHFTLPDDFEQICQRLVKQKKLKKLKKFKNIKNEKNNINYTKLEMTETIDSKNNNTNITNENEIEKISKDSINKTNGELSKSLINSDTKIVV